MMPSKLKLKVKDTSDEEDAPRVASSAKKGKRSRQIVDGSSDSERAPPAKRRSSNAGRKRPSKKSSVEFTDSESENEQVDVEGTDSDAAPQSKAAQDDDDAADTDSSHSASTVGRPAPKRQQSQRPEKSSKSRSNRIQSDEEGDYEAQSDDDQPVRSSPPARKPAPIARPPTRQPTASSSSTPTTKPLRKPVTSKSKDDKPTGLSNIPAIPRRPKDASVVVKDTQDMDLLNKDVYNQLFNTSTTPKPAKNTQNEAKQKEINAKRAAAKAALLEARTSSFDLQLPTDKVLAFENRLRKIHRWYAPSALGFTYHEELRLQRQRQQRLGDGNSNPSSK